MALEQYLKVFADLLAQPGVEEIVELRSTFGFLAFHGGSLEEGTDVVAAAAASKAGASLYAVVQPEELRWHIPSRAIDPAVSPRLAEFLAHIEVGVALHGYGRPGHERTLLLGGSNRSLASALRAALERDLPRYRAVDDLDAIPPELRGLHSKNPVNLPRNGGVQLELPPHVRGTPAGGSDEDCAALIKALAAAAGGHGR